MKNIPKILKIMFVVFFTLQILFYTQLHANKVDVTKLDHYIENLQQNKNAMFSVSIMDRGMPVYFKSVGYIDPLLMIQSSADTKYRIGEVSKTFTAIIFMQMVEAKIIQLGTPLSRFFPEIPNAKHISIHDLLSERLNVVDYLPGGIFYEPIKSEYVFEQLLIEQNKTIIYNTETKGEYSFNNANYLVLGMVMEKITGKKYHEVLKEKIVDPLNLENTYDGSLLTTRNNEACSFEWINDYLQANGEWDLRSISGAGSIISTPYDLGKLMDALFDGKVISEKSLKSLLDLSIVKDAGLQTLFGNKIGYSNTGRIDGFVTEILYFPVDGICISFSMNATGKLNSKEIMNEFVRIIYGS